MAGRFGLSGADMMELMAATVAAGVDTGLTDAMHAEVWPGFFDIGLRFSEGDAEKFAEQAYISIQNTLMAIAKDDFLTIQKEPPFRSQGQANFIAMVKAYQEGGVDGLRKELARVRAAKETVPDAPIRVEGGTGASMDSALRVMTADRKRGVAAEYWYLNHRFGPVEARAQSLREAPGKRYYDVVTCAIPGGESRTVYFDITEFHR
jgi:hypothetical protein